MAQTETQLNAERNAAAKLEEEFLHPKAPAITRRAVLGNPQAPITINGWTCRVRTTFLRVSCD